MLTFIIFVHNSEQEMFGGAVVPACLTKFEDETFQKPNVRSQKIIETSELMIAIGNLKIQYVRRINGKHDPKNVNKHMLARKLARKTFHSCLRMPNCKD